MSNLEKYQSNLLRRLCVGDILSRSASIYDNKVAIWDDDFAITHEELREYSAQLGSFLYDRVGAQGKVGVIMINSYWTVIIYFACASAGLTYIPINPQSSARELRYYYNDASMDCVLTDRVLLSTNETIRTFTSDVDASIFIVDSQRKSKAAIHNFLDHIRLSASTTNRTTDIIINDDDSVQVLYTSGTTSNPKGVVSSHKSVLIASLCNIIGFNFDNNSIALMNLPLFHSAGIDNIMIPTLHIGGTLIISNGFNVLDTSSLIEKHNITYILLLPSMFQSLLRDSTTKHRTFPSVRTATYAMGPIPTEILDDVHSMFPNADLILGSGLTEGNPSNCIIPVTHQRSKAGSWGISSVMTRLEVLDEQGNIVPRGTVGEIGYRSPQVMKGYNNMSEATKNAFRNGWLHSGDLGWMDDDGFVWFVDRLKDIIKSGGETISSQEIERCLLLHEDVRDAAVVGVRDEKWGEAVSAAVVLKDGADSDVNELRHHCLSLLAPHKVPKYFKITSSLKKTGSGKIKKADVRKLFANK